MLSGRVYIYPNFEYRDSATLIVYIELLLQNIVKMGTSLTSINDF